MRRGRVFSVISRSGGPCFRPSWGASRMQKTSVTRGQSQLRRDIGCEEYLQAGRSSRHPQHFRHKTADSPPLVSSRAAAAAASVPDVQERSTGTHTSLTTQHRQQTDASNTRYTHLTVSSSSKAQVKWFAATTF